MQQGQQHQYLGVRAVPKAGCVLLVCARVSLPHVHREMQKRVGTAVDPQRDHPALTLPEDLTPFKMHRYTMVQERSRHRHRFQRILPGSPIPELPWMCRT